MREPVSLDDKICGVSVRELLVVKTMCDENCIAVPTIADAIAFGYGKGVNDTIKALTNNIKL